MKTNFFTSWKALAIVSLILLGLISIRANRIYSELQTLRGNYVSLERMHNNMLESSVSIQRYEFAQEYINLLEYNLEEYHNVSIGDTVGESDEYYNYYYGEDAF